jgi:predicted P-loop ATPase/GTPase
MDMVAIERLVDTLSLKTSRLTTAVDHGQVAFMYYDKESDNLLLLIVPPTTETVVHYIDEHMALLYEPASMEVVGFQVEAFQHSFMAQQVALKRVWRLGDSCAELKDLDDLIVIFEQKKQVIAHELANIAGLLGQDNTSRQFVPA